MRAARPFAVEKLPFLLIDLCTVRHDPPPRRDALEMTRFTLRAEDGQRSARETFAGSVDSP